MRNAILHLLYELKSIYEERCGHCIRKDKKAYLQLIYIVVLSNRFWKFLQEKMQKTEIKSE